MSDHNYNFQKKIDKEKIARAYRSNAKISTKYSVEFSNYFKNMPLEKAIQIAENIKDKKEYLPLKKYNKKVAHRKGENRRKTPSGRWPVNVAKLIIELLLEVKANAENKDLDTSKLKIIHMFANKGVTRSNLQPLGRIGGKMRQSKSTNIEVIVLEE
jgi:large subunit ribosomal protein L22